MIMLNEIIEQVFLLAKGTINDTILNTLLTFFYNVFKTLKWKYMLNMTFSD